VVLSSPVLTEGEPWPAPGWSPISQALRNVSVSDDGHYDDEFNAIGPGRHRDVEDWLRHPRLNFEESSLAYAQYRTTVLSYRTQYGSRHPNLPQIRRAQRRPGTSRARAGVPVAWRGGRAGEGEVPAAAVVHGRRPSAATIGVCRTFSDVVTRVFSASAGTWDDRRPAGDVRRRVSV
jgi:hypothetical protein